MRTILSSLLPSGVSTAESFGDFPGGPLWPEEITAVERAVEKRRREFSAGRALARVALERLGTPAASILVGPYRQPTWPPGIVGSITHCVGYCGAAVALRATVAAIGIDAEPDAPLPPGALPMIALEDEQAWIQGRHGARPDRGRLLFSAKESVFKAWFPLTGKWLDFIGARIAVDEEAGTFDVQLLVEGMAVDGRTIDRVSGRFAVHDGLLLTAVAVPRAADAAGARSPAHAAGAAPRLARRR